MRNFQYWILSAALLLSGCRQHEEAAMIEEAAVEVVEEPKMVTLSLPEPPSEVKEKKLIKTAEVSFAVNKLNLTYEQITGFVKKYKGYISEEREYKSNTSISKSLQVQIPTDHFDAFIEELSKEVKVFDRKNIHVEDVTDTYIDTEARLNSKRNLEQRYLEILRQAKNVEEIINIEKELENIRFEIESSQSRLAQLNKSIRYSGIQIQFYEKLADKSELLYKIKNAFTDGWRGFLYSIVFIIKLWPFAVLTGLFIFWFRRRKRKNN